jgi:hypothetical protein
LLEVSGCRLRWRSRSGSSEDGAPCGDAASNLRLRQLSEAPVRNETIGGIGCQLELGGLTPDGIENLIRRSGEDGRDASHRAWMFASHFLKTPFYAESALKIPEPDTLRVRLVSFDCITFIYTVVALARARNLEDFVSELLRLRYLASPSQGFSSDPRYGNMFDFVYESLIVNAVDRGIMRDATSEVADGDRTARFETFIGPLERPSQYDPDSSTVTPRYGSRVVGSDFIPLDHVKNIRPGRLVNGDVLLMTKVGGTTQQPVLIRHAGIAHVEGNLTSFIHATGTFNWEPKATGDYRGRHTGIFLDARHRMEQLGVSHAYQPAHAKPFESAEAGKVHGYCDGELRSLESYMRGCGFTGLKVMRIAD